MEQLTKILTSNFTSNALITAFVVVGIVCWVAAWISTHVFRGKIHSSAKKGFPTSRFLAVLR